MRKTVAIILVLIFCFFSLLACGNGAENVVLSTYRLTFEYSNGVVYGNMEYEYQCEGENMDSIVFALYANCYRENATHPAYSDNQAENGSYGNIEISNCYVNGERAASTLDANCLFAKVDFGKSFKKGQKVVVKMDFCTKLQNNRCRLGQNAACVNLTDFYPLKCAYDVENACFSTVEFSTVGEVYNSDFADYEVCATLPSTMVVASGGDVVGVDVQGEKTAYYINARNSRNFAMVLSENFSIVTKKCGYVSVNYYYVDDKSPDKTIETAADSLAFFAEKLGGYKYKSYSIVQSDTWFAGMEYPALSFVGVDMAEKEFEYCIVHETAHQWFPITVGSDEYSYPYIDEGLAEYLACGFFEYKNGEKEDFKAEAVKKYRAFLAVERELYGGVNERMDRQISAYRSVYEYYNVVYVKGLLMFYELENCVGEQKMWACLKKAVEEKAFKRITMESLCGFFGINAAKAKQITQSYICGKAVICLPDNLKNVIITYT